MSVTRPVSEFDEIGCTFGLSAAGQRCLFCGQLLSNPAVFWAGADGQTIYLHGGCVIEWMPRLMRDALEILYVNHPRPLPPNERSSP